MATQLEIILWKSHPKWEVNCGQHMKVKCSPTGKKKKKTNQADFQRARKKESGKTSYTVHNDCALFMWMEVLSR